MKKALFSIVAAMALTLGSAAWAQDPAAGDKVPPPPGGSADNAGAPSTGSDPGRPELKKETRSKHGGSSDADKSAPNKK